LSLNLRAGIKETESSLAELSDTMRDLLERRSTQAATIEESTAAIEAARDDYQRIFRHLSSITATVSEIRSSSEGSPSKTN
jgi:methyl-accepting chemotaxis protein